jgi:nitrite reductase/ring-hydroxylating ferredoxin subunit
MVEVVQFAELRDRVPTVFQIGGREVALVRWGTEVFALRNLCPHQSQSFVQGTVHERVLGGSTIGDVRITGDKPVLSCPWHSWEFDLRSGQCAVDPKLRVGTYPTQVIDGMVKVDIERATVKAAL